MKLNLSCSLNGISDRGFFIVLSVLATAPIIVNGQFSYRFELLAEKTFSGQTDKINFAEDYISYFEKTERMGGGAMLGVKYNMIALPISLIIAYENNSFSDYSIESNISVSNTAQELKIQSADLNIQYVFFNKATLKPSLLVGFNFNSIDYSRAGVSYRYSDPSSTGYIPIDEINWGYNSVKTNFNALGANLGAGLNIRLSDKIGISGNAKVRFIPQEQTNWLDDHLVIRTYSLGGYFRLSKRKNNILL